MPYLQSIESLVKENIIATQNRPIIVHSTDQNYYFCKYHTGVGAAFRLFKEYLIVSFISNWGLNHAEYNFVDVLDEHVPADLGIQKRFFRTTCFGSKKINDTVLLSKLNEDILLRSKGKKKIKEDILTIAFFDMLFANEDRHSENYNLLISQNGNEYELFPIDHEACFNHQNIDRPLVVLTYEDTLIYSTLFNKLFNKSELKDRENIAANREKYYLCYRKCVDRIEDVVNNTPNSWLISTDQVISQLKGSLTDEWFSECWKEFLYYIQLFISDTQ